MRTVIRGTTQPIEQPSTDLLCDMCDDKPAVMTGVEYRATSTQPAEHLAVCADCGDTRAIGQ